MKKKDNAIFSLEKVRQTIEKNKKDAKKSGPSIAFLPEGEHNIRWLFDPEGENYREIVCHKGEGKNKWILCPDWLAEKDPSGEYPICGFCQLAEEREDWKLRRRFNYLVYGYVKDTKNESDYWEAGNTYVIIGNSRLKNSLLGVFEQLDQENEEYLLTMLTPTIAGPFTNVVVTKGPQGSVQIFPTVSGKKVPPIEFEENAFIPLSECWIPTRFDMIAYSVILRDLKNTILEQDKQNKSDSLDAENHSEPDTEDVVSPLSLGHDDSTLVEIETNTGNTEEKVLQDSVDIFTPPSADQLPEGCPGWTNYDPAQPCCCVCDFNMDCLKAGR